MRYKKPAIVEALCEFVFEPSRPWDLTVFGEVAAKLPQLTKREQGEVMSFDLQSRPDSLTQQVRREPRMRFSHGDGTRIAQVGTNLVSAHVLAPYPHWPVFRGFILDVMRAFVESAQPASIRKVTLRYIDRIQPDQDAPLVLGDWLAQTSPYVPGFIRDATHPAHSRVQKQLPEGTETVTAQLHVSPDEGTAVLLDTEVVRVAPGMEAPDIEACLDALHDRIIEVFESCISDHTRAFLEPES